MALASGYAMPHVTVNPLFLQPFMYFGINPADASIAKADGPWKRAGINILVKCGPGQYGFTLHFFQPENSHRFSACDCSEYLSESSSGHAGRESVHIKLGVIDVESKISIAVIQRTALI